MTTRVLIQSGDGFRGWLTSLHLSALGHDAAILDNLPHRKINVELEREPLAPVRLTGERPREWKDISGNQSNLHSFTTAGNYQRLSDFCSEWRPRGSVLRRATRSAQLDEFELSQALHSGR